LAALSNALDPPLLAMIERVVEVRRELVGKFSDANEVPVPLRPACGQKRRPAEQGWCRPSAA
jgi:hypothetical protein